MMEIRTKDSVKQAKKWFEALESTGTEYQSYSVLRACEKCTAIRNVVKFIKAPWRMFYASGRKSFCRRVYSVWEEGCLLLLAPLCWNENGVCVVAGERQNLDYQDFIYDRSVLPEKLFAAFEALMAYLRGQGIKQIVIGQLPWSGVTKTIAEAYLSPARSTSFSVSINLPYRTHEDYFAGLSKHVRQNVRTAYNRLKRDGHEIAFRFFSTAGIGCNLKSGDGESLLAKCRNVYRVRQEGRYRRATGILHRLTLKYVNYTTLSIPGSFGFLAVLLVDGKVGAFMEGYVNRNRKALEVPRLAIDDEFAWYSPGMVLVNEAVDFMLKNTNLRIVDLCRGTEKYKTDMGGEIYETKRVQLNTEVA